MSDTSRDELTKLTHQLLLAIETGDWDTYERICDPDLTCFEPESRGMLVQGLDFHRYYFDRRCDGALARQSVIDLQIRLLTNDCAVVTYVRLNQLPTETWRFEETRVWKRTPDGWRHVHFHRSKTS